MGYDACYSGGRIAVWASAAVVDRKVVADTCCALFDFGGRVCAVVVKRSKAATRLWISTR